MNHPLLHDLEICLYYTVVLNMNMLVILLYLIVIEMWHVDNLIYILSEKKKMMLSEMSILVCPLAFLTIY